MLHAQRKHFMMLGQNVAYALQNTALLAAAVKQDSEKRGEPINKVAVALASSVEEVPEVPASSLYTDDMISISNELIDQAAEADQLVKRVNSNNELVQALVGVVSTLQWGFGDLFVCWFNGFGWKVCY